ncbi:MAG: type III pantothenate kinase [Thermodesulfobacteriota bacterium]
MLLVIDVGNTHTVVGIYDGDLLRCEWRIRTRRDMTGDEVYVALHQLFKTRDISESGLTATIVSCVVPAMKRAVDDFCRKYLNHSALWVDNKTPMGMPILYRNPAEVGADRIVNAVAAYERYRCALIVIDFGTATTFDCISEAGEYLGGAISPGIGIASEALFARAAKLPRVELFNVPETAIGRDTVSSMQAGILFGYAGLVDGIVARIRKEMGETVRVIATGGLATLMANVSECIEAVEPNLTLEGLRLIHRRIAESGTAGKEAS